MGRCRRCVLFQNWRSVFFFQFPGSCHAEDQRETRIWAYDAETKSAGIQRQKHSRNLRAMKQAESQGRGIFNSCLFVKAHVLASNMLFQTLPYFAATTCFSGALLLACFASKDHTETINRLTREVHNLLPTEIIVKGNR